MFRQFRGPGFFSIGDGDQHAELAGFQSGTCERAVIDSRDHSIQLADTSTDAYAFDFSGIFGHKQLYMQPFLTCQVDFYSPRSAGITLDANSSRCGCAQRGGSPGGSVHE